MRAVSPHVASARPDRPDRRPISETVEPSAAKDRARYLPMNPDAPAITMRLLMSTLPRPDPVTERPGILIDPTDVRRVDHDGDVLKNARVVESFGEGHRRGSQSRVTMDAIGCGGRMRTRPTRTAITVDAMRSASLTTVAEV
jgi:hypothetical protein